MPSALQRMLRTLTKPKARRRGRVEFRRADTLETRILPTAVVSFTGTAMTITSDTSDNNITVVRVGNQVLVDANGGTITVAGSDVPNFLFNLNGAFNLTAKFSDGNDGLTIAGGLQLKSVNIAMGDGASNQVLIQGATLTGKLTVDADGGADVVAVQGTSVTGTTLIDTGWNNDILQLSEVNFTGATTIKTDLGTDVLFIVGVVNRAKFGAKLTITTGDDSDILQMNKLDTKAISIDTGDGTDVVLLADVLAGGAVSLKTGSSVDQVQVIGVIQSGSGTNAFDLGSDTDVLSLTQCSFVAPVTINLGSGVNNFASIDDVSFNNTFTLSSKGQADIITVEANGAAPGQTTFAKAAKFNVGLVTTVTIGSANPGSIAKFLSTASFTGTGTPNSTLAVVGSVSFFSPPVLKKFTPV
ncbi:hypothetical protein Pan44_14150 [Caulifigura coniformis]|uniref:Uncharacterized protein n=1 Tax=Caulifigura coniformis TaxID=2527983 RepID=A0A517SBA8_9PLAN|nr:hypothetical protein [Caulifigura coniformis]QDT53398.1 hypothetical protein Pan44_14150 [Caulifigura coniformis]